MKYWFLSLNIKDKGLHVINIAYTTTFIDFCSFFGVPPTARQTLPLAKALNHGSVVSSILF